MMKTVDGTIVIAGLNMSIERESRQGGSPAVETNTINQHRRRGLSITNRPRDHVGRWCRRVLRIEQHEDWRHRVGRVPWRGRQTAIANVLFGKYNLGRRKAAADMVQERPREPDPHDVSVPVGATVDVSFMLNASTCKAFAIFEKMAYTVVPSGMSTVLVGDDAVSQSFSVKIDVVFAVVEETAYTVAPSGVSTLLVGDDTVLLSFQSRSTWLCRSFSTTDSNTRSSLIGFH
ncbi:hypothetical protein ACP4OV_012717 [Aristida adscensionis]